jgi:hypothetical protein
MPIITASEMVQRLNVLKTWRLRNMGAARADWSFQSATTGRQSCPFMHKSCDSNLDAMVTHSDASQGIITKCSAFSVVIFSMPTG